MMVAGLIFTVGMTILLISNAVLFYYNPALATSFSVTSFLASILLLVVALGIVSVLAGDSFMRLLTGLILLVGVMFSVTIPGMWFAGNITLGIGLATNLISLIPPADLWGVPLALISLLTLITIFSGLITLMGGDT